MGDTISVCSKNVKNEIHPDTQDEDKSYYLEHGMYSTHEVDHYHNPYSHKKRKEREINYEKEKND
jgi:hypothetical protein